MADDSKNDTEAQDLPAGVENKLLQRYFRDFAAIPLLTPEQEVELSRRIKAGDKAAHDELVRSNLRLVVKIAWQCRGKRPGVSLLDLIQEGNLGLMRAADDFDGGRGCRFATYAGWWIRASIIRGPYSEPGSMHIPHSMRKKITKMNRASKWFANEHGREPDDLELAEVMGIKLEMLWKVRRAATQPISVETPVYQDGRRETIGDRIPSEQSEDPVPGLRQEMLSNLLAQATSLLTEKELKILKLRFGLDDDEERTLQEIGVEFGVTRERIRQIEKQALGKLRDSPLGASLAEFLE